MVLPSSGPISLGQVATEFGGTTPHSLSEYYGKATGIPASGTISLFDFYGKALITSPPTWISSATLGSYAVNSTFNINLRAGTASLPLTYTLVAPIPSFGQIRTNAANSNTIDLYGTVPKGITPNGTTSWNIRATDATGQNVLRTFNMTTTSTSPSWTITNSDLGLFSTGGTRTTTVSATSDSTISYSADFRIPWFDYLLPNGFTLPPSKVSYSISSSGVFSFNTNVECVAPGWILRPTATDQENQSAMEREYRITTNNPNYSMSFSGYYKAPSVTFYGASTYYVSEYMYDANGILQDQQTIGPYTGTVTGTANFNYSTHDIRMHTSLSDVYNSEVVRAVPFIGGSSTWDAGVVTYPP